MTSSSSNALDLAAAMTAASSTATTTTTTAAAAAEAVADSTPSADSSGTSSSSSTSGKAQPYRPARTTHSTSIPLLTTTPQHNQPQQQQQQQQHAQRQPSFPALTASASVSSLRSTASSGSLASVGSDRGNLSQSQYHQSIAASLAASSNQQQRSPTSSPSSPVINPTARRLAETASLDEIRLMQSMRGFGVSGGATLASPPGLSRRPSGGTGLLRPDEDLLASATAGRYARRVQSTHAMLSSPASTSSLADPSVQDLWNDEVTLSSADFTNIPILVSDPDNPERSFLLPPSALTAPVAESAAAMKGREIVVVGDEIMVVGGSPGMPRSKSLDMRDHRAPGAVKSDPHQPLRQPAGPPSSLVGGAGSSTGGYSRSVSEWPSLSRKHQSGMLRPQGSAGSLVHQAPAVPSSGSSPSLQAQQASASLSPLLLPGARQLPHRQPSRGQLGGPDHAKPHTSPLLAEDAPQFDRRPQTKSSRDLLGLGIGRSTLPASVAEEPEDAAPPSELKPKDSHLATGNPLSLRKKNSLRPNAAPTSPLLGAANLGRISIPASKPHHHSGIDSPVSPLAPSGPPSPTGSANSSQVVGAASSLASYPSSISSLPMAASSTLVPHLEAIAVAYPTTEQIVHPDRSFTDFDALISDIVKRMLYREEEEIGLKPREGASSKKEKTLLPPADHAHITLNVAGAAPIPRSPPHVQSSTNGAPQQGHHGLRFAPGSVGPTPRMTHGHQQQSPSSFNGNGVHSGSTAPAEPLQLSLRVVAERVETQTRVGQIKSRIEFRRVVETEPGADIGGGSSFADGPNGSSTPPTVPGKLPGVSSPRVQHLQLSDPPAQYIVGPVMGKGEEPSLAEEIASVLETVAEDTGSATLSVTVRSFVRDSSGGTAAEKVASRSVSPGGFVTRGFAGKGGVADARRSLGGWYGDSEPCGSVKACAGDLIHEVWGYNVGPAEICPCGRHLAEGCRMYKLRKEVVAWVCSNTNGFTPPGAPMNTAYQQRVWQLPFERFL
ncbi:hypothetical protein DFJ73DRAFT_284503 [Zopfochytrium polystomum]|nr:hypothetical protein DFJ73DRAFT_284503 [Zopfochytrium polystomum]